MATIIGSSIRTRREELNLTQQDLANMMGYKSKSTINKIEAGINDVTQTKIEAFAKALDTTSAYLMGWKTDVYKENILKKIEEAEKQLKDVTDEKEILEIQNSIDVLRESYEDLVFSIDVAAEDLKEFADNAFGTRESKETPEGLSEDEEQLIAAFRKLDPILRKYILFSVVNASRFLDITLELDRIENEYRASYTQQRPDDIANAR